MIVDVNTLAVEGNHGISWNVVPTLVRALDFTLIRGQAINWRAAPGHYGIGHDPVRKAVPKGWSGN